jgi:hypothetical protein
MDLTDGSVILRAVSYRVGRHKKSGPAPAFRSSSIGMFTRPVAWQHEQGLHGYTLMWH